MKRLYFSGRYYKSLASKKKTVTIRLSTSLKPGEIVEIFAGKKYVGKARIVKIERRRIREIDRDILRQENMETLGELIEALIDHYGPTMADPDSKITVIRFEWL